MANLGMPTVLQYTGYSRSGGGILAVLRTLAAERAFRAVLGAGPGFRRADAGVMGAWRGPAIRADEIGLVSAWQARQVARRVLRWLRRNPRRIFHGHTRAGLLVALWLARWGERRVMATVHSYGRQRWFYRRVHRVLGRRVVWLSPAMKEYYAVGDGSWSGCLPDCVPAASVRPCAGRPLHSPVIFGCVGALVPVKNWELVIRAFAELPPSCAARMRHAGGDNGTPASRACAQELRRLAAELLVEQRIEWLGPVRDMPAFYDSVDCVIVPSRLEGFGVAPVEAVAAGVPVLVSDGCGARDLVASCRGGWLFPTDSPRGLAGEMARLSAGIEFAGWRRDDAGFNRFLAGTVAAQHVEMYRELLRDARPGDARTHAGAD